MMLTRTLDHRHFGALESHAVMAWLLPVARFGAAASAAESPW